MLKGRHIALGITGSIAAYKAADLASKLTQAGALVDVLMTEAATRFIAPLTLRSLTRRPGFLDMFDPNAELAGGHGGGRAGQRADGTRPAGGDRGAHRRAEASAGTPGRPGRPPRRGDRG